MTQRRRTGCGFGTPIDDPNLAPMMSQGVDLDEIVCAAEYAQTTEDVEMMEDSMGLGHIITAMPPIHAIPAVVAAPPGIMTYNDLPLTLPRGIVAA